MRAATRRLAARPWHAARGAGAVGLAALLASCPPASRPPADHGGSTTRTTATRDHDAGTDGAVAGPVCESAGDCEAGTTCVRSAGCEAATGPGRCVASDQCRGDLVTFCDCDGAPFYASETCPERAFVHLGGCDVGESTTDEPGSATRGDTTCDDATDCGRTRTCVGIEGCTTIWTCARSVRCVRDTQAFCGCDGATFRASMTCPGRPFRHRGACEDAGRSPAAALDGGPRGADAGVRDAGSRGADAGVRALDAGRRDAGAQRADAGRRPVEPGEGLAEPPVLEPGECASARDCGGGEVCEGAEGCSAAWRCAPAHPCTRDTQYFCGCDGRTFRASMQCPGRPYVHRGACAP